MSLLLLVVIVVIVVIVIVFVIVFVRFGLRRAAALRHTMIIAFFLCLGT